MQGVFITIEGPDGAGKTTLIEGLATKLTNRLGVPLTITREPGGHPIAEQIREIILSPENTDLDPRAEALLYAASRAQHLVTTVIPAIERGELVLCDRFVDSSIAYQGYGRQLGEEGILQINRFATNGIQPDLTLYLDISANKGIRRIKENRSYELNRLDQEAIAFHERVVAGYMRIAEQAGDRIKKIDAELEPQELQEQAFRIIQQRFPELFN